MNKSIDLIVLGATGFTGKCAVKFLAKITENKYQDIVWGVAGRSKEKLDNLITELNNSGTAKDVKVVEADIEHEDSLRKMLKDVKVLINCTGPNMLLSPKIVKVCIETKTHYVDITAEMLHIYRLYRDYNTTAKDANVLIVPACGFSAIPVESAMIYLDRQFRGTIHTVECYTQIFFPTMIPGKAVIHNGTWTSTVHVMDTFKEQLATKREIFPKPVEEEPEEMNRSFFHRHSGHFWFPYPGVENGVVEMSQRFLNKQSNKKPVHFKAYTTVEYFFQFIVVPAMYLYYYLTYFKCFRNLLINFPRCFTIGYASEKGPSDKMRQDMHYYFTLNAKGWELDGDLKRAPTKTLSVKVSGRDPGYETTAVAIIMSAITLLKEGPNMPKGGVITPGAAFHKTDIVNRLMDGGYKYEII